MSTSTGPALAVAGISLSGCGPPSIIPGPTLPWWLVFAIIGGIVLYAYLRRGK